MAFCFNRLLSPSMARGKFINLLCRLFCFGCYRDEDLPSDPPPFPCGVHDGTATDSCTCGLDTLGDGSVDFYKFEEDLRALLEFPEQSDPDLVGKEEEPSELYVGAARIFFADELWEAVNFFNPVRKLGAGGFGSVYLGKLKDGHMVAVKKLYVIDRDERSKFMEEIDNFCNLRHPNLVTLYGCTSGMPDLLLVYEYMTNGNVAEHIHKHGEAGSKVLTWDLRIQIAIETAEALSFLHFHPGRPPIIHCDVKTDNLLLDDNFHVKVCDFGLSSKRYSLDRGTLGYLDPEFDKTARLTAKSDVYSFGVVLLEFISGKKAVDVYRDEIYLVSLALDMIANEQLEQLVDENIGYQSDPEIRRMINMVADLACSCLCSEGNKRPSMQEVVWKLKRIRDNKDHGIEHIDYSSPDQAPTYGTVDINNFLQLIRHRFRHQIIGCVRELNNSRSNTFQLGRHNVAFDYFGPLSNSCGHKLSTVVLFFHFSKPAYHTPSDGTSCSCRLYLQDNRILDGLASSRCFVIAVCNYTLTVAALNEIPFQVAQRMVTNCMTTFVKESSPSA